MWALPPTVTTKSLPHTQRCTDVNDAQLSSKRLTNCLYVVCVCARECGVFVEGFEYLTKIATFFKIDQSTRTLKPRGAVTPTRQCSSYGFPCSQSKQCLLFYLFFL